MHAIGILNAFVEVAREAGSPELEQLMQKALVETKEELNRALGRIGGRLE